MKTSLGFLTICGFAMVAVSGCNKPEAAPAPSPTQTSAPPDASSQSGLILRPSGMGAGGSGSTSKLPAGMTAPPSNAPPNVQQQMQRMNGGFGNR